MKLLLDENFPLQLYHHLKAAGHDVDHIVIAGQRGLPDSAILRRLQSEDALVFVTQDTELLAAVVNPGCAVIVSRVLNGCRSTSGWNDGLGRSWGSRHPAARTALRDPPDGKLILLEPEPP